ncbi:hypothetical protein EB796_000053 [Bugula neritina]|uniref:Uncharacterized protein n=1 Tax=Bugula neritina TaxID=10212 RepID=A0A7J7KTX5_BUGNE|nr:hypothetical protein EB796_000053 [Bugula neritina]
MKTDIQIPRCEVHYPSVDTKARAAGTDVASLTAEMNRQTVKPSGFKPGPFETRLDLESNYVPAINYEHTDKASSSRFLKAYNL